MRKRSLATVFQHAVAITTLMCPTINKLTGLSDSEKQAKLDAFASQVTQAAY